MTPPPILRRHPSRRDLATWADSGAPDGIGDHLATCVRCAERLEELADVPSVSGLRTRLAEAFSPPGDLDDRLRSAIDERLRGRGELQLIAELFSVPLRTARVITRQPAESTPTER